MRKSVSALMAFMIFTLSLACTMPFCPAMANVTQAQVSEKKASLPCHGESSSDENKPNVPMLSSDCVGVDLFQQNDQAVIVQADLSVDHIDFAWADLKQGYDFLVVSGHLIRGPPFATSSHHLNNHNLYLTTQRLRI